MTLLESRFPLFPATFWLMDFRNQLSMAAWFVLRAGYLFLRTAKCHRLCGDSINQPTQIINNQSARARRQHRVSRRERESKPWPDTSCRLLADSVTILKNCQSKKPQRVPRAAVDININSDHVPKTKNIFLDFSYCSPLGAGFDELHDELCTDNCFLAFSGEAFNCPDCWLTRFHLTLSRIPLGLIKSANLCTVLW